VTYLGTGTFGGPEPLPDGAGRLAEFRQQVAAALDTLVDVSVHVGPVDNVTPPAYLLVWPDRNLEPHTACFYRVRLQVVCVGARLDPAPGYDEVERLVEHAVVTFDAARLGFEPVGEYLPFTVGGVDYLAARLTVTGTISLEGAVHA
jgi:hypothetical protein